MLTGRVRNKPSTVAASVSMAVAVAEPGREEG